MNLVEIAGHLGADPETRVTPNGVKITTLRVATNSRRQGKDETIWWRVTIFGDRFDKMLVHFRKGSAIIVIGELNKPEIWMDKEGRPQITLEVVAEMVKFSPFGKPDRQQEGNGNYSYGSPQNQHQQPSNTYGYTNAQPEQSSFGEPAYQPPHYQQGGGYQQQPNHGGNLHGDEEIPF